jgi:hypothetical protein
VKATPLVLAALLPLWSPGRAQEPDTTRRPIVEGGVYDKPHLTRLLGRTALGGYAEAHARYQRVDGAVEEAGFVLRRWNMFTNTQVSDVVRIAAELEFEDGGDEITIEFAAIDVGISAAVTLRAGILLSPLGRFNLSHDSPRNEFTDRPLVATELLGVALSEPGLGVFGLVGLGGRARLTYELYAVNGFHSGLINDSPEGTRIPSGRRNFEDNNASPAFIGRLAWSPRAGYELGVSAHHGAYNVFRVEGQPVDERRDLTVAVLDVEARLWGVKVAGEAAAARIEIPPALRGVYAQRQRGAHLEILRPFGRGWISYLPRSSFTAGARLDVVDFDADIPGDMVRQVTVGLNFRPSEDNVLKLDYVRGVARDRFNNPSAHAGLLFSVATYF